MALDSSQIKFGYLYWYNGLFLCVGKELGSDKFLLVQLEVGSNIFQDLCDGKYTVIFAMKTEKKQLKFAQSRGRCPNNALYDILCLCKAEFYGDNINEQDRNKIQAQRKLTGKRCIEFESRAYLGDWKKRVKHLCNEVNRGDFCINEELEYAVQNRKVLTAYDVIWIYVGYLNTDRGMRYTWVEIENVRLVLSTIRAALKLFYQELGSNDGFAIIRTTYDFVYFCNKRQLVETVGMKMHYYKEQKKDMVCIRDISGKSYGIQIL
jgi:hypothetical protein